MVLIAYIMTLVVRAGFCENWFSYLVVFLFFASGPILVPSSGFSTLVITFSILLILGCLLLLAMVSVVVVVDIRRGSF